MKTTLKLFSLVVAGLLMLGCNFTMFGENIKLIDPSDVIITEERAVSGFDGIVMSTFGQVTIQQGDLESLSIQGSDNIVPLVKTSVRNGILTISMKEDINVTGMNSDNMLTFTITVKDLTSLEISGAGKVSMESLSTTSMIVNMSGAGQVTLDNLTADSLETTISGLGDVKVSGEVTSSSIDISGAGSYQAYDLQARTGEVTISGLGGAELWVTEQLTGTISGSGGVSYYGNPQANTNTTGLGSFKSLGSK